MVQLLKETEEQDMIVPLQSLSDARQGIIEAISNIKPHKMIRYLDIAVNIISSVQAELVHEKKQETDIPRRI